MSCTKKGYKSVFGESPKTSYIYADIVREKLKRKYDVLVVDCLDGYCLMPFARKRLNVDGYESEKVFLYGGKKNNIDIMGLKNRIDNDSYKKEYSIKYYNTNYYLDNSKKKYDFVYVYKSLHRNSNEDISMLDKVNRLLDSVSDGGFIYIFYHLAIDEKDYVKYPKNQYLRSFEMTRYFNKADFTILNCHEREKLKLHKAHIGNEKDHEHRIGYIFAQKQLHGVNKNYKFHYKINCY